MATRWRSWLGPGCAVAMALWLMAAEPARAQDATPTVGEQGGGSLRAMLGRVPASFPGVNPPALQFATYVDLAGQLTALGFTPPRTEAERKEIPWAATTDALVFPPTLGRAGGSDWRQFFGFDLFDVDQALLAGEPPDYLALIRVRRDAAAITTALTASGYKTLDVDGVTVYSLAEDASIDLDLPVHQLAFASMNNVALLADDTLVAAPTLEAVRGVLAVQAGAEPPLTSRDDVAALLDSLPVELVSALLVNGEALRGAPDPVTLATPTLVGVLPPVRVALLGVTPGGPLRFAPGVATPVAAPDQPVVSFHVALLMDDRADAEAAVPVIAERLATGVSSRRPNRPYAEFFSDRTVTVAPDAPVVLLDLSYGDDVPTGIWLRMFISRDLVFLAW